MDDKIEEMIKKIIDTCKTDLKLTLYLQQQFSMLLAQHAEGARRGEDKAKFALKYCVGYLGMLDDDKHDLEFIEREERVVRDLANRAMCGSTE